MGHLEALSWTIGTEVPVVLLLAWLLGHRDRLGQTAAVAAAASLVTHPLAWYLSAATTASLPFWASTALIETAVVAAEAFIYRQALRLPAAHAFLLSLSANALSFGVGLAVYWYL